jgi:hypothetical protein
MWRNYVPLLASTYQTRGCGNPGDGDSMFPGCQNTTRVDEVITYKKEAVCFLAVTPSTYYAFSRPRILI